MRGEYYQFSRHGCLIGQKKQKERPDLGEQPLGRRASRWTNWGRGKRGSARDQRLAFAERNARANVVAGPVRLKRDRNWRSRDFTLWRNRIA